MKSAHADEPELAPAGGAPRGRQGRAYGERELLELLRTALCAQLADGSSFASLSVERLITAAGIARSTFYAYFADKQALLRALSAASLRRLFASNRAWLSDERPSRAQIARAMRAMLEVFLEEEPVLRAVAEASGYDTAIREAYVAGVQDYARVLSRLIASASGGEPDPGAMAGALTWMIERTISRTAPSAAPAELDRTAAALAEVIWRTIYFEHDV